MYMKMTNDGIHKYFSSLNHFLGKRERKMDFLFISF